MRIDQLYDKTEMRKSSKIAEKSKQGGKLGYKLVQIRPDFERNDDQ